LASVFPCRRQKKGVAGTRRRIAALRSQLSLPGPSGPAEGAGTGFVSQNWVRFAPLVALVPTPRPKLGSFCAFRPPGWRPTRQIGFVLHNHSPAGPSGSGHPRPFPGAPGKLGLFCIIAPVAALPAHPRAKLASFCTIGSGQGTARPPRYPRAPKFGFVSHNSPSRERRSPDRHNGRNWVCFAHFALCRPEATGRRAGVPPQVCSQSAIRN
jgi:hypothetical protein